MARPKTERLYQREKRQGLADQALAKMTADSKPKTAAPNKKRGTVSKSKPAGSKDD